jgi:hypothetical protein
LGGGHGLYLYCGYLNNISNADKAQIFDIEIFPG